MNTQQLFDAVRQWGISRGITGPNGKGTLLGQLSKTQEELTETRDAAVEWGLIDCDETGHEAVMEEIADGIGDTMVTLILAAEMAGMSAEECLAQAYQEIAGRTGRMVNGQFCKDQ
jgi:NTP pyrophosphatase (non-canonical NTP hydrolase)